MTRKLSLCNEFRNLAENLPDAVIRYDRAGRQTYINTVVKDRNDASADQAQAEISFRTMTSQGVLGLQEKLMEIIASGKAETIDLDWEADTGRKRCVEFRATPEFDPDGSVAGVLAVTRDVSEQRESHRQLSLLKFALDHVAEAFYLMDENAKLLHVNSEACRALGYSPDELLNMTVFDIDPDFSPERWREHWQHIMTSRTQTLLTRNRTKSGQLFPVEVKASRFEFDGRAYSLALMQDITERQRSEQEFRALVENSPDTIVRYDRKCRRLYANPALARLTGLPVAELLGKRPSDYALTASARAYEQALISVVSSGQPCEIDYCWRAGDGRELHSHLILTPEFALDGQVASVFAVGRDVSALKESERRLRQAESMARLGHWQWDSISGKAVVSGEICQIFGRDADWEPKLDELLEMMLDEDRGRILKSFNSACSRNDPEILLGFRIKSGKHLLHLHSHVHVEYGADRKPQRLVGTTQDISELKSYESRLYEMAFHDALTGLPNRMLLGDRLNHALEKATRCNQIVGLLILDLDRFKEVNETRGHDVGDLMLHQVGERLRRLVRDYDTVARLGGDEFAIVLPELHDASNIAGVARKILATLLHPFHLGEQDVFISASIGIAVFPSDGTTTTKLLQYADAALYDAKARGRAGFRYYSKELTTKSKERSMLESALRRAEEDNELEVFYQPKIDLANGHLVGAEALLRWRSPSLGLIQPDKFIGIAEDTGLIVSIGAWVLDQACHAACRWNPPGAPEFKIAVNFSSRQFQNNDLVGTVSDCLERSGCQPSWLEFEITESLLLKDDKRIGTTLKAFRDMGISIAIDDFGTGYSSLGYLKRFPINVLKIDRSFINDVMLDRDSTELVKGIITMAHSLRLELVAEGIETEVQEEFLQLHGCHLGQGYRYGKPMPGDELAVLPLMMQRQSRLAGNDSIHAIQASSPSIQ